MKSAAMTENSRMILCDPVCVFSYGHNVAAMVNFRNFVGKYFKDVVCLGSRHLPVEIGEAFAIERAFDYYYNDAMPIDKLSDSSKLLNRHADKLKAAKSDLMSLIERHQVTHEDFLCYPSIDFYSLHALADSIDELQEIGSPTILVRLIG